MIASKLSTPAFRTSAAPAAEVEVLNRPSVVEIIDTEQGFRALEPCWDRLLEQSATRTPFLRWDWMRLWWEIERERYDLAITVVRNVDGHVQAIAPLVLGRPTLGARRSLRHLSIMGGIGQIESQRLDFIVPRGMENRLTPRLCEAFSRLGQRWDIARFIAVPEESPNLPHILAALHRRASGASVVNTHDCHFIDLPANWHDYEMQRSINWRGQMRRKWKAMATRHQGRTALAGVDISAKQAMEDFMALHARRWPEGVSEFLRPAAQVFHQRLAALWIPQGRTVLPYIEIGGRMAGGIYGLVEDDTAYLFQMGWDPGYEDISMGKLAMALSIQDAMARQARRYDMLPGDFEYKKRWGDQTRRVLDIEAFRAFSARAAAFRILRAAKRLVRRQAEPSLSNPTDTP